MSPINSLQLSGTKKNKARITSHLCCNSTGTEKLPIWFIGTAARPLAFQDKYVNLEATDMVWRHNGTAWMTSPIMKKWLHWFDSQMSGRKVILCRLHMSLLSQIMSKFKVFRIQGSSSYIQIQQVFISHWIKGSS